MAIRNFQQSFNGGETAPSMFARISDAKYQTGMALCKNFLIEPQGPIVTRPGFVYVNKTKHKEKHCRLIPFNFSITQTMVLEFGERYVRFHTNGQTLIGGDGQPYEIATPYAEADLFDIHYVQSADVMTLVHPNYPPKELRRYGATDWRLVDIQFGSSLTPPTGLSASQTINKDVPNPTDYKRTYAVTALMADGTQESVRSKSVTIDCNPYGDGSYNTIRWNAVANAGLYRVYRDHGGIWAYVGQTEGTSIIDENITPDASITPPIYDDAFRTSNAIAKVVVTNGGSGFGRASALYEPRMISYKTGECFQGLIRWNHGDGASFVTSGYDGRMFNYPQNVSDPYVKELIARGVPCYNENDLYIVNVLVIDAENNRNSSIEPGGPGGGAEMSYTTHIYGDYRFFDTFTISGGEGYVKPRLSITYKYAEKNYSKYYRETQQFALGVSEYPELIVTDSTGRGAELQAQVNNGAISGVSVVYGGEGYTAPTVSVRGGNRGASFRVELSTGSDFPGSVSYFEQRRWFGGTYMRPNNIWATRPGTEADMSYSLPSQSDDRISVRVAAREANRILHIVPLAQLMLLTGAGEWRVSPLNSDAITPESMSVRPQSYVGSSNVQPLVIGSSMIYGAARGGHLRELGYNYEAGGYISGDVCLRAPHLFDNLTIRDLAYSKAPWPIVWAASSSGKLVAMTYVPEQQVGAFSTVETEGDIEAVCSVAEGEEDVVYVVTRRTVGGEIVRFIERMHERQFKELKECVQLDCSGTYRGAPTTEVSGLDWLEGETVSIVADGAVEPDRVVEGGKITIDTPASVVHVGIPFTCDMKTLPAAFALQDGSFGSGHKKNVREVFFRVVNSSGTQAGPSFEKLSEYPSRSIEFAGSVPDLITDEFGFAIYPQWSQGGEVCVRQKYPLPLRIISMTTVVELA